MPPNIATWFHVVDIDHTVERLAQTTTSEIALARRDLEAIASALAIAPYVPVGAPLKAASPARQDSYDPEELPDSLQRAIVQVEAFLNSDERLLVITGMIGTGLELLLEAIVSATVGQRRHCSVFAPNRRIAAQSAVEAESVYTAIYAGNPKLKNNQFVFELATNHDSENHLYVLGDAHLISDTQFDSDSLRYGSGQLLTDLLNFANFNDSRRQLIVLGDPFQLSRGKADESALCAERLHAITGFQPQVMALEYLMAEAQADPFVHTALSLAQQMQAGRFNYLQITCDPLRCIEAPVEPVEQQQFLQGVLGEDPTVTKLIAFSHLEVNRLNHWVRQTLFNRTEAIVPGDLVHIHNSFFAKDAADAGRSIYVPNDTFAQVIAVDDTIAPLVQPLKGREQPIAVDFLRLQLRLLPDGKAIDCLCLRNYLYAEKPEVEAQTMLALHISAKNRFYQQYKHGSESSQVLEAVNGEEAETVELPQLTQFLRNDRYFNAARLRFGYAMTLHRAQGQRFRTVIANLDTGTGQTNEAYFRWLYTLFAVVGDRLVVTNAPRITPLSKAIWQASKGKLEAI